jgi:hypothetical protein
MENSEKPPTLRVLIAVVTEKNRLVTHVVAKDDLATWVRWGWSYVATDPQDQEDLIQW